MSMNMTGFPTSSDIYLELDGKKVAVVPGTAFNCDPAAPSQSFRLNYSTPSDEQIAAGIGILAETAGEFLR